MGGKTLKREEIEKFSSVPCLQRCMWRVSVEASTTCADKFERCLSRRVTVTISKRQNRRDFLPLNESGVIEQAQSSTACRISIGSLYSLGGSIGLSRRRLRQLFSCIAKKYLSNLKLLSSSVYFPFLLLLHHSPPS